MKFLVTSEPDLIRALKLRRRQLGLTQLELDDRAGFQDGYTGKLESLVSPDPPADSRRAERREARQSVRRASTVTLEWWVRALGGELLIWFPEPGQPAAKPAESAGR